MAYKFFWRNGLTGGGDNLDGIASGDIGVGGRAIVSVPDRFYLYFYDSTSVLTTSSPDVIRPTDDTGAWLLQKISSDDISGLGDLATQDRVDLLYDDGAEVNNISDVNATDLTDGGDTTLHDHAGISENTTHRGLTNNPHSVDKTDVSLGNVDNTSDANKPVSSATQTALDGKADSLGADDNYVTDAEKVVIGNTSGTNTGDQILTGLDYEPTGTGQSVMDTHETTHPVPTTRDSRNQVAGSYEPAKGADDNFVTDAEKTVIGNTSGTNSGDNAVNSNYSGLVSNANHTGDVTGSTALTIADNAVTLAKMTGGTDGNLITYDASGDPAYVTTGTADQVLTSNGAGAAPTFQSAAVSDPILGFTNKSSWADDEEIEITLDTDMSGLGKAHVSVYEEVPTESITSNVWDITTGDTGFTLENTAYAVTLTPDATSGAEIDFTLGSGSWASTDVGKIIKNVSAGETGEARIISIASGVATCQISAAFTNTDAIASGDWEMYAGEFVNGAFELGYATVLGLVSATPEVFDSTDVNYNSVTALSSTKAIVCYRDVSAGGDGTAVIVDISDGIITFGEPVVFEDSNAYWISVSTLSSTQAIVCYQDDGNSDRGTACILDVSGSTITPGTPVVFETGITTYISVAALTSTKAIVCYTDGGSGNYGFDCILDVSGSTITPGTPDTFQSADTFSISVARLTDTRAIVCYEQGDVSDRGEARLLDVSGTTVTERPFAIYESDDSTYNSVARLSDTKAIVCYKNPDASKACILDISGTTITPGTPVAFENDYANYISVAAFSSTQAIVCYEDDSNVDKGSARLLNISGSTITPDTSTIVYEDGTTAYHSVAMLTPTTAIVCYEDQGNNSYGTACILNTESSLYIDNQYIPTISGTDSVDTTLYTDLDSITTLETLNDQTINYAFSFNPTFTSNEVSGGTFVAVGEQLVDYTLGTPEIFELANSAYISQTLLTSTKAIVCYEDDANSDQGTACILDISGSTITAGTPDIYETGATKYHSVARLTDTKAIVCYQDDTNSDRGTACILDVSGSTITSGTPVVFETGITYDIKVVALTSTKAIVCFSDSGDSSKGKTCILDVSGSTITPNSSEIFDQSACSGNAVARLTDTKAVVCYSDGGTSSAPAACVLDVSGSTITPATRGIIDSVSSGQHTISVLSSTKAVACYRNNTTTYGKACIIDISGSTVTAGTPVTFEEANADSFSVATIDSTQAIVCYSDAGNSSYGTACLLDISESTITPGSKKVFESADTTYISASVISTTETIISYNDAGNSGHGTAIHLTLPHTIAQTSARNIISSLNSVHDGTDSNWYVNTNGTYGSETWTVATTNNPYAALAQAMATSANQMAGPITDLVLDATWPDFGTDFAASIILHTDDDAVTPSADKVSFDYSANVYNQVNPDYEIILEGLDRVFVTAPSSGGPRNARVYISK